LLEGAKNEKSGPVSASFKPLLVFEVS